MEGICDLEGFLVDENVVRSRLLAPYIGQSFILGAAVVKIIVVYVTLNAMIRPSSLVVTLPVESEGRVL